MGIVTIFLKDKLLDEINHEADVEETNPALSFPNCPRVLIFEVSVHV